MSKFLSVDLRIRVLAAVSGGATHREAAERFGSQCVVVAIDVRRNQDGRYEVVIAAGTRFTGLDALDWAKQVEQLGAGEILLTSMDKDGTRSGYDLPITRQIADAVSIPVIASGGAGCLDDFYTGLTEGGADAVLAASLFHFGEIKISHLKDYLALRGIPIRPPAQAAVLSAARTETQDGSPLFEPALLPPAVLPQVDWSLFKKDSTGLVPAIIREASTQEILMLAYLDQTAWMETLRTGLMHYYSRSRGKLWLKGETSGHFQQVRTILVDCDADTLLVDILQIGPACHTGAHSCFYRRLEQL